MGQKGAYMVKKSKELIYKMISCILPKEIRDCLWGKYYIWNVKRKGNKPSVDSYYIKNPKKTKVNYCLFRFGMAQGLFAVANKMLFYYDWAIKNHFIPLVDMGYEENFIKGELSRNNKWEYCFQQVETIDKAIDTGNVLVFSVNGGMTLSSMCKIVNNDVNDANIHAKTENYQLYYSILNRISKDVWRFQPEVEKRIYEKSVELFKPGMRVLGVVLREEFGMKDTDMTQEQRMIYKMHPKSVSIEETLKNVLEYMEKWKCTHVLVTTVFQESLEFFQSKLGEKVIYVDRKRRSFEEYKKQNAQICEDIVKNGGNNIKKIHDNEGITKRDVEEGTVNYLIEMAMISKCNFCMGVKCSGLIGACILNGGNFEGIYIFEDENSIVRY